MAAINITRRILRIDDAVLIDLFKKLTEIIDDGSVKTHFSVVGNNQIEELPSQLLENAEGRYSFQSAKLGFNVINPNANGRTRTLSITYFRQMEEKDDPLYDRIIINLGPESHEWRDFDGKMALINDTIAKFGLIRAPFPRSDFDGALEEIVRNLGFAQQRFADDTRKFQADYENRRIELEKAHEQAKSEFENIHRAKIEELQKKEEELNLRSHKAERRAHFTRILSDAQQNAGRSVAPKGAIWTRWGVAVCAVLGGIAATAFAYVKLESVSFQTPNTSDWLILGTGSISALAAVGFFAYAANWLRNFYLKDFAYAQEQQRFLYDLNRASWVVEAILEMEREHGAEVPEQWVEGVTRNLFAQHAEHSESQEADILAALLGITGSLSVGPDGTRLEMGKRELRRARRKITKDAESDQN